MSIYNDVMELERLIDSCANPETGEISEEDYEAYELLKKELTENGLERLAKVRANKLANVAGIKAEIERLKKAKEREEKAIDRIEGWMLNVYSTVKKEGGIKAGTFTISTRRSTQCVISEDFNDKRFITEEIVFKTDKNAVKTALKNGEVIAGAELLEKENLIVR